MWIDAPDVDATQRLGALIGRQLRPGDTVFLRGGLGAGKTSLARSLIRAFTGEDGDIPSPTYALVCLYGSGDTELWHADLYRLEHPQAVVELGLLDAIGEAVTVIEWPERLGDWAPRDRLDITLEALEMGRRIGVTRHGAWRDRDAKFTA